MQTPHHTYWTIPILCIKLNFLISSDFSTKLIELKYYVFFNSLTIEERIFNNFFLKYVKEHFIVGILGFEPKTSCSQSKHTNLTVLHPVYQVSRCKYTTYFLNKQIIFTLFLFFFVNTPYFWGILFVGTVGFEPTCNQLPFLRCIRLRGYVPVFIQRTLLFQITLQIYNQIF